MTQDPYIGAKIKDVRSATDKEAELLEVTEDTPLLVAELDTGAKLFLFSDETEDGAEVAFALNKENILEELFEQE